MLLLVGNKSDLEKKVSQQEIEEFCSKKEIKYVETSSTDHLKTRDMFQQLGEAVIERGHFKGVAGGLNPRTTLQKNQKQENPNRTCFC